MTDNLICADCGEPAFVITPARPTGPSLMLCASCYAARWEASYKAARSKRDSDAAYQQSLGRNAP